MQDIWPQLLYKAEF